MSKVTVYKASAGSGKTFTLAVEYIRLLMTDPQQFHHTLAVTFTNKATGEMKDRILEQLYGVGHGLKESTGYLAALQKSLKKDNIEMTDDEIRHRCLEALRYILHDYSRFRIETIDSFFQSVLRNLAHELGLNARLQVDLNDKQILSQAVDNMVDNLGKDQETGMLPWIDRYVQDQLDDDGGWDIRKNIKELAKIIFTEHYMNRDETFKERLNDEDRLKEFRKSLMALKVKAEGELERLVDKFDKELAAYPGDVTKDVSSGSWIIKYRDRLLQGDYRDMTDKQFAALHNPVDLVKKSDKDNDALLRRLQPLCDAIIACEVGKIAQLHIINSVNLSITHVNPLRLLSCIDDEVTAITNDANRFILARTPQLLSRLIGESDAPFVFEKMGTIFNNVMIDEFQDTSRLQWNNFKVLLLESQASGGKNMLVGDIKQSIYRFRNGDWRILKDIDRELHVNRPKIETLNHNFRSDTRIIGFNNAFFTSAAQHLQLPSDGGIIEQIYSDVRQFWPEGKKESGYVRVMLKTGKADNWDETMLNDMCQHIIRLHEGGLPYNKMAILLRRKAQTQKIIAHLAEQLPGVQVVSEEGYLLSSSKSLQMLIAALKVLHHGDDDPISMRFLIKSYMTHVLGLNTEIEDYINADAKDILPKDFVDRQQELSLYPLHELCEELFRLLHLSQIKGDDAYVLTFFDLLAEYLRSETSDIQSFLQYWEDDMQAKSIPSCEVDGISIITIHKSKGLQYHTVMMPFIESPMDDVRPKTILWCQSDNNPYNALGSLPINGGKDAFSNSEYSDDFTAEQLQRRIEELNVQYVGFTRAEHNLLVWGSATGTSLKFSNLLNETLSEPLPVFEADSDHGTPGEPPIVMDKVEEDGITTYTLPGATLVMASTTAEPSLKQSDKSEEASDQPVNRLQPIFQEHPITFQSFNRQMDFRQSNDATRYIHQAGEEDVETESATEMSYIEQGKLLHELFSKIERADQLEKSLMEYVDQGILVGDTQVGKIRRIFTNALHNPLAQSWFDGTYQVLNECEIVHLDETGRQISHRTDRVMVSPTEVIVVDFKFGHPNPDDYIPQVQNYMNLLRQMYPDHTISGYLWYVYRNRIEKIVLSE